MIEALAPEYLEFMQRRLAVGSITPSALRNVVGAGSIDAVATFLGRLSLGDLEKIDSEQAFLFWLNKQTELARDVMKPVSPQERPSWGGARKCVNIFLFECLVNRLIYAKYEDAFDRITPWLEIPLDSYVGTNLKEQDEKLPDWDSVKRLDQETSNVYQASARQQAVDAGIARVFLELRLWQKP